MHRRAALALQHRSDSAAGPLPAQDVQPGTQVGANGVPNEHGHPIEIPTDPSLLGLPGVDPSALPSTSSSQTTTSSQVTTSSSATSKTTSVHATASGLHNTTTAIGHQVTPSASSSVSAGSAVASASSSPNSGSIGGGVAVGIIVLAALICLVVYLMRRSRRHGEEQFDASEFRRSAVLMSDPPTHEDTIAWGFNLPPPAMTERKQSGSPLSPHYDSYNNVTGGAGGNHDGYFVPTQAINPICTSVPHSPSSYATVGHSPASGQASTLPPTFVTRQQPSPRRASRPASGNDPGAANGFTFPRRQNSRPNTGGSGKNRTPKLNLDQPPQDDYVDLSRSSVSPFQAAQYVEISMRLNSPVPRGLGEDQANRIVVTPSPTETTEHYPDAPPVPPKSPFEDPESIRESLRDSIRESYSSGQSISVRVQTPELQDFPVPPSPAPTATSRYRIDSLPPVLPELNLDLIKSSSFVPNRRSLVPKYQSSPLASEDKGESKSSSVKRPETVYNPNDVYGGI